MGILIEKREVSDISLLGKESEIIHHPEGKVDDFELYQMRAAPPQILQQYCIIRDFKWDYP